MDLGVRDRGYLVFGGTAGMGFEAARLLAEDGARVAIVGRDGERAVRVAARIAEVTGAEVVGIGADLTDAGAADAVVADVVDRFGSLRGMAVTTGLGMQGQHDLLDAGDEAWAATFDDVLLATVRACRAVVPVLVEHGGGSIVTTSAYSIRAPKPHQMPYAALKAGVAVLTKNIAKAFGPQGIRANCVCPGATETGVLASMRASVAASRGWPLEEALERVMAEEWGMAVALGRAGRPDEVGDVIAFLLSERAGYLTGATINVDGGTDF